MNPSGDLPDWQRKFKKDIGENPARFLDRRIPQIPESPTSMFRTRLKGIDKLEVVGAWEAAERILAREQEREPRPHVMRLLEERREYLLEHGERDLPKMSREERRERARELFEATEGKKATSSDGSESLSATQKLARMRSERGEA